MPDIDIDPATGAPVVKTTAPVDTPESQPTSDSGTSEADSTVTKTEEPVTSLPPVAPTVTTKPAAKVEVIKVPKTEKEECLEKMNAILAEHGGLEGNVGMTSEYWDLLKKYRSL